MTTSWPGRDERPRFPESWARCLVTDLPHQALVERLHNAQNGLLPPPQNPH